MAESAQLAFSRGLIDKFVVAQQIRRANLRDERYIAQLASNRRFAVEGRRIQAEQFATSQAATERRFQSSQAFSRETAEARTIKSGDELTDALFNITHDENDNIIEPDQNELRILAGEADKAGFSLEQVPTTAGQQLGAFGGLKPGEFEFQLLPKKAPAFAPAETPETAAEPTGESPFPEYPDAFLENGVWKVMQDGQKFRIQE